MKKQRFDSFSRYYLPMLKINFLLLKEIIHLLKGAVMLIEKALINDRLRVSKVSWNFRIPNNCDFAVIYPWNLLFSLKVAYFLTVSIAFSVVNKTLRLNNLKTNAKISVFVFVLKRLYKYIYKHYIILAII